MRKINISNDSKRDAEVAFGTTFHRPSSVFKTAEGKKSFNERRVRATMKTTDEALLAQYGEGLADALITGDPEVDMEQFGLKVEGLKKVYVTPQQKVAYGVTLSHRLQQRPQGHDQARYALLERRAADPRAFGR